MTNLEVMRKLERALLYLSQQDEIQYQHEAARMLLSTVIEDLRDRPSFNTYRVETRAKLSGSTTSGQPRERTNMPNTISNSDDLIDSRDVIARIKELTDLDEISWSQAVELTALQTLADESAACSAGWQHGETLIRDSYLKTYAQQNRTSVTFDGVEYWIR